MRLTLRTMLAYLDNDPSVELLKPEDAAALGEKIQQSEYATKLADHVRSSITDTRVGAPDLTGRNVIDPNAVAEYLDSTLPSEQIEGYEKLCLPPSEEIEGPPNENMAETAACHQILTLVLGNPIEFPGSLRTRIYRLDPALASSETTPAATTASVAPQREEATTHEDVTPSDRTAEPDSEATSSATRAQQEVPEYLRNTKPIRLMPLVVTLVLGFVFTFVALRALGPFGPDHPLLGSFLSKPAAVDDRTITQVPSDQNAANTTPEDVATASADSPTSDNPDTTTNTQENTGPSVDAGPVGEIPDNAARVPADNAAAADAATSAPSDSTTDTAARERPIAVDVPDLPATATVPPAEPEQGSSTAEDNTNSNKQGVPAETSTTENDNPATPMPPETVDKPPTTTTAPAEAANGNVVEVGRFSGEQVLIREKPDSDAWYRVKQFTTLKSNDHLKVLPGYRPQIALTSGIQLRFVGPSDVTMRVAGDQGRPDIEVAYARALAVTDGMPGHQLGLRTAGVNGTITLNDVDTVIALETKRYLPPGTDPLGENRVEVTQILVTGGTMSWQPEASDAAPIKVAAGQALALIDDQPPQIVDVQDMPPWTDPAARLASEYQYSTADLEKVIKPERPVSLSLMEQLSHRGRDLQALVARSLSYLDMHEPLIAQLGDKEQRSYWYGNIDVLQDAIARSPGSAQNVLEAFEKKRADAAPNLFRLTWGYSPAQLTGGAAAELVAFLESEEMDIRVLTAATLKEITNRTHSYRPERDPKQIQRMIQDWKKELEDGDIKYETMPSPLPQLKNGSGQ